MDCAFPSWRRGRVREQAPTSASTHLSAFTSGLPSFVWRPFVGGALLVGRASALAGNLTLLFW